ANAAGMPPPISRTRTPARTCSSMGSGFYAARSREARWGGLLHANVAERLARNVFPGVNHMLRELAKILKGGQLNLGVNPGILPCEAHIPQPTAGAPIIDDEWEVAAAKPRVAVEVAIARRPTEPLHE